jgi:hypothetical protein
MTELWHNSVVGFFRSRIEGTIGEIVRGKGLFEHPFKVRVHVMPFQGMYACHVMSFAGIFRAPWSSA